MLSVLRFAMTGALVVLVLSSPRHLVAGAEAGADAAAERKTTDALASTDKGKNYYDYCGLCRDHTLCRFYGPSYGCASRPLDPAERDEVLAAHNTVRWVLATGQEVRGSPGPQPAASNMRLMWYDDELAAIAQRWADQCHFKHDSCRNVERFSVGQNIYLERTTRPLKRPDWDVVTRSWYDEVAHHNGLQTFHSYRFSPVTGHFTQLSWADTFLVGCGIAEFKDRYAGRQWNSRLYVCNYGPAGNELGRAMYRPGDPCTDCGQDSYCYYGLCV